MPELRKTDRVFVSGHRGLLGSALVAELQKQGYSNVLTAIRAELDLTHETETYAYLKKNRPKVVIHCAALVGGIQANSIRPAEFLIDNLRMQSHVIHGAHLADVEHLVFFGSNCMYPSQAPQPISENQLLQGPMEPSNLAYGTAKVSGLVQTDSYRKQYGRRYFTIIPSSLYGPNDCFAPEQSHVTPALILKFHQAKRLGAPRIQLWGSGKPRRELLFSRDAAKGVVKLLESYDAELGAINLGAGVDLSVREIGETIAAIVDYRGEIEFDTSKADGGFRKLLDSSRARQFGFHAETSLQEGLKITYDWLQTSDFVRGVPRAER